MTTKRKLSNFDFSGGNHAIALVSKDVGGPANGVKTLITKSTDVVVELSMAEFMTRFFNVWTGDAQFLAGLLGYSTDTESVWDNSKLAEQVTLMKSMKSGDAEFNVEKIKSVIKALADKNSVVLTDFVEEVNKSNNETPKEETKSMSMTQEQVQEMLQAEITKAVGEQAEIVKGLKQELEIYKQREEAALKDKYTAIVKGYSALGLDESEIDGMATALIKMNGDAELKVVTDLLNTAVNKMTAVTDTVVDKELGSDADAGATGASAIMKYLQSQKS